ncbi:MAG: hypothetical protein ACLFPU_10545 [Dehalococcoidia bacterium]
MSIIKDSHVLIMYFLTTRYQTKLPREGELAKLGIGSEMKDLIAGQIDGLSASNLPDNLEMHQYGSIPLPNPYHRREP